jgi:hypothetical protein
VLQHFRAAANQGKAAIGYSDPTSPECGGSRRLLAFILQPSVIERILSYLGLPTEPPQVYPARASPEQEEFGLSPMAMPRRTP